MPLLIPVTVLLASLLFAADLALPLGVAGGVPYVAVVLLGLWYTRRRFVFALAAIASLLTVAGYFLSPHSPNHDGTDWMVAANRALALGIIWVTAGLLAAFKTSSAKLRQKSDIDMTALKEAESALRLAKNDAEAANRAKSEFLASMSHELRTPLNAILGFGQLLESNAADPLTETQRKFVDEIMDGGRHLLDLINEVLDLAKIEAGKVNLTLEPVAVAEIVDECLALTRPLAEARNIEIIDFNGGHDLPDIRADTMRLKQIFLNLLSNAVKYNCEGGKVSLRCQVMANGMLRTNISDTGPGIDSRHQSAIFQPFDRLGAEGSGIEGAGMGLSISRQLAELMNGEIGFESSPGQGTTFWIDLPIAGD